MRKTVVREGGVFVLLLVLFALLMHPDLLTHPAERFAQMQARGSWFHPLLYTLPVYGVLLFLRGIVKGALRLLGRSRR